MHKILIVEDDVLLLRMYERLFEAEGFKVSTAVNGEDFLQTVAKDKPSVILLDIMMPKMDGLHALKILKADDRYKTIPVFVLTNVGSDAVIKDAFEIGITQYIT